ncbi:MAG: SIS domain-containing protein [Rhodobacterales bacterium]|nr:SIS domain-containing protein [Rhodobacterales bacterium]
MTALRQTYRNNIVTIIDGIIANQSAALDAARDAVADALRNDGLIHVAGSGHSHLLAEEVFYRAGGIAAAQAILDEDLMLHRGAERSTLIEREPGQAARVLSHYTVTPGDVVIIASNSGRNAYPIELALLAKEAGATTIALTSLTHAQHITSRHPSGKRLFELTDVVLDNGGAYGDGSLAIPGLAAKMGPTSTIIGVYLLNTVMAEAVALLAAEGIAVDIYQSANTDQGDSAAAIMARWRPRIPAL